MAFSIAIIGIGSVGSTIAHGLVCAGNATEIILLDRDTERCAGEVLDLSDGLTFSSVSSVRQGTYDDAKKADIVIISAGRRQKKGETRLDLVHQNKEMLDDVVSNLTGLQEDAIVIIVSNPLDILTYFTLQQLALPRRQIFGTGTFLDTQRLKQALAQQAKVSACNVEAMVLGEHGDSLMIPWSNARIAGSPLESFLIDEVDKQKLEKRVRNAAYSIINKKGATYYGIASCVVSLCSTIQYDRRQILPLSWYQDSYGVCMSLPLLISRSGVEKIIPPPMTDDEEQLLEKSAEVIRSFQKKVRD